MNKKILRRTAHHIYAFFCELGLDVIKTVNFLRGILFYLRDWVKLVLQKGRNRDFPLSNPYVILDDKFDSAGTMTGHYFHQDLLIAQRIFHNKPERHIDIGSRTDGFVAHVASFRPIEIIDIRPIASEVRNITFQQADLMQLPKNLVGACDSISALHAIEHFGLGRYNDPIDYNGHLKALDNIHQILKKGGKLYFSVPMGPQRIEFNAHRVFSVNYLRKQFDGRYKIDHFSYVDDAGRLHEDISYSKEDADQNYSCDYGCAIFELTKL
jgi:SAM-dependent methyltransferase